MTIVCLSILAVNGDCVHAISSDDYLSVILLCTLEVYNLKVSGGG